MADRECAVPLHDQFIQTHQALRDRVAVARCQLAASIDVSLRGWDPRTC